MIKRLDLLSIDITLQCNYLCQGCNKFVYPLGSNSYVMSMEELESIMTWVAPKTTASYIRVIGGEPLTHPHFIDIIKAIQSYGWEVEVATNGSLLHTIPDSILDSLIAIKISDYHKRNALAVSQYRGRHNVHIINSLEVWRDPEAEADISLSELDGHIAYWRCPMGTIKVCNWKVWDCCAAEAIERHFHLEPTHAILDINWKEELDRTTRASTCQRCYFGQDTIRHLHEIGEYERECTLFWERNET